MSKPCRRERDCKLLIVLSLSCGLWTCHSLRLADKRPNWWKHRVLKLRVRNNTYSGVRASPVASRSLGQKASSPRFHLVASVRGCSVDQRVDQDALRQKSMVVWESIDLEEEPIITTVILFWSDNWQTPVKISPTTPQGGFDAAAAREGQKSARSRSSSVIEAIMWTGAEVRRISLTGLPYKQPGSEPLLQSTQLVSEKTKSKAASARASRASNTLRKNRDGEEKRSERGAEARAARKQQVWAALSHLSVIFTPSFGFE